MRGSDGTVPESLVRARVNYTAVGASASPELMRFPPAGFSPLERTVRIGHGAARWAFAVDELMTWRVKLGVPGFSVARQAPPDPSPEGMPGAESVYDASGEPYASPGETVVVTVGAGPFRVREPVRVISVIDEPDRRGFSYGTLPGHPLCGEEQFTVERRPDGGVWFTVRSFARPGEGWRLLAPAIAVARRIVANRYAAVLARPI